MKKTFQSVFLTFSMPIILLISGCAPALAPALPEPSRTDSSRPTRASQLTSTPQPGALPEQISGNDSLTIAEAEKLAGFEIREPTYLPKGVSFEYATYEIPGFPGVTLQFKLVHEQYGDVGRFFLISQEQQAEPPAEANSCGQAVEGCEILQVNGVPVVYHLYTSSSGNGANTEGFAWYRDGFFFRLHRMAGEPNKVYKEELLKVVESIK